MSKIKIALTENVRRHRTVEVDINDLSQGEFQALYEVQLAVDECGAFVADDCEEMTDAALAVLAEHGTDVEVQIDEHPSEDPDVVFHSVDGGA